MGAMGLHSQGGTQHNIQGDDGWMALQLDPPKLLWSGLRAAVWYDSTCEQVTMCRNTAPQARARGPVCHLQHAADGCTAYIHAYNPKQ